MNVEKERPNRRRRSGTGSGRDGERVGERSVGRMGGHSLRESFPCHSRRSSGACGATVRSGKAWRGMTGDQSDRGAAYERHARREGQRDEGNRKPLLHVGSFLPSLVRLVALLLVTSFRIMREPTGEPREGTESRAKRRATTQDQKELS